MSLQPPQVAEAAVMDATPRADSPLQGQSMAWQIKPATVGTWYNAMPGAGSTPPSDKASPPSNKASPPKDSRGYRFVVVTDPTKLKDKDEMQKNRSFVMHDFLEKERSKPETEAKDPRARKRKRVEPTPPATSINPTAATHIFRQAQTPRNPNPIARPSPPSIDQPCAVVPRKALPPARKRPARGDGATPSTHLVPGQSRYCDRHASHLDQGNPPLSRFNGKLNPFDTWPNFRDPSVDVSELKYSCMLHFGSPGLVRYWIPLLLQARHAFLSTMAVSSAHDDIMRRACLPQHSRGTQESLERQSVRDEVTEMLNRILDTGHSLSDSTIAAVIHLLQAGIMGRDEMDMRVHQNGVHVMVQQRGGLACLGAHTHFAPVLTIAMFTIGVLRETRPELDYVFWAQQSKAITSSRGTFGTKLESPVFYHPSGYVTLSKQLPAEGLTYGLLEALRQFTDAFRTSHSRFDPGSSFNANLLSSAQHERLKTFWSLRDKVSSFAPGEQLLFANATDQYIYEAVRLTAQIYVEALTNEVSFSQAAMRLKPRARSNETASSLLSDSSDAYGSSFHIRIRDALQRTDTTNCWNHLAGVLLWITLVAGASANPDAMENDCIPRSRYSKDEEARTYLAAITVRTNILLSFEHPHEITGTLEGIAAIQACLTRREEMQRTVYLEPETRPGIARAYGPQRMPQRGMIDFAMELQE